MRWDIIQGHDIPSSVLRYTLVFQVERHSSCQDWYQSQRQAMDDIKKIGLGFSWVKYNNEPTGHTVA